MDSADVIVVIDFERNPEERYSKVWKRLEGTRLEQRVTLPQALLAQDNLLEMPLDEAVSELRIDRLRWEHGRQTLHVHAELTEDAAYRLRALGLNAWRPWLRRKATGEFLDRCRRSGWTVREEGNNVAPAAATGAPAREAERLEPTL